MVPRLQQLARQIRQAIFGPDSAEGPRDPYSYVRHPLVQRPGGRNAAVALEEPDEDEPLMLVGKH
jgi:hypothetical protein